MNKHIDLTIAGSTVKSVSEWNLKVLLCKLGLKSVAKDTIAFGNGINILAYSLNAILSNVTGEH